MPPVEARSQQACAEPVANKFGGWLTMKELGQIIDAKGPFHIFVNVYDKMISFSSVKKCINLSMMIKHLKRCLV